MKKYLAIIIVPFLTACIVNDYPNPPAEITDESEGIITITQIIDSNEVLADYSYNGICKQDNNDIFKCDNMKSYSFGHFSINTKDLTDNDKMHVKGVKKVGVYRYTSALGAIKTVPDYTINNNMNLDKKNEELQKQYNENFPEKDRKNYQSILPISCHHLDSFIYMPFSLIFSPFCLFNDKCYFTFDCITDEELSIPYKDRK